jgi:hypothetical protein
MGLLVAGTKYRGEFEERLKKLMEEIKQSDEIILFIDEVHTLIGAGAAEGAIDAANILKPALARGELQVVISSKHLKWIYCLLILSWNSLWYISRRMNKLVFSCWITLAPLVNHFIGKSSDLLWS